jgi:hypothetical protein
VNYPTKFVSVLRAKCRSRTESRRATGPSVIVKLGGGPILIITVQHSVVRWVCRSMEVREQDVLKF